MIKRGPLKVGLNHPQPLFSLLLIPFLLPYSPSDATFISYIIPATSLGPSLFSQFFSEFSNQYDFRMRESNFAFPAQNRAAVCISSQLYDRRGAPSGLSFFIYSSR